jgi:MFS family permease
MDSFLFALLAVVLLSLGARDQLLMARLSETRGGDGTLLITGIVVSIVSAAAMAISGAWIAALLPGPARQMLIAFALLAAAFELVWPVKMKEPKEPTRSLGAFAIVLGIAQFRDAARFAVFAFAAATLSAPLAGFGGAIGGAAALYLGWSLGNELESWPLRPIRWVLAGLAAIAGVVMALMARGILG